MKITNKNYEQRNNMIIEQIPEEAIVVREQNKKCFTCDKIAICTDWTGWKMCFRCWRRDYKWGRCHGIWQALKDIRLIK